MFRVLLTPHGKLIKQLLFIKNVIKGHSVNKTTRTLFNSLTSDTNSLQSLTLLLRTSHRCECSNVKLIYLAFLSSSFFIHDFRRRVAIFSLWICRADLVEGRWNSRTPISFTVKPKSFSDMSTAAIKNK
jgi:hypothetical protein